MMKLKKFLASVLLFCMVISLATGLTACAPEEKEDPNTLTITIRSDQYVEFFEAMVAEFPDINFEIDYYEGEDPSDFLSSLVKSGEGGDLLFNTLFTTQPEYTKNMLDLSGYSFIGNIRDEVLDMVRVEDKVYFVPSPMDIRCVIYNKTMFEEYGWAVPNNLEEMIALVKQIRTDAPGITPIGMSSKSQAYGFTTITTFAQTGFLSTPAGYSWEQEFFAGNASFEEGMKDGLTITEMFIDADAFDPEKYTASSSVDTNFVNRECAMIFEWSGMKKFMAASTAEGVTDEFGFLPFYGLNGEKLLAHGLGASLAINSKLGEAGNEEKLANAIRVLEWYISPEAQELIKSNETQLSITKDTNNDAATEVFAELMELSKDGYTACMLYSGYEEIMIPVGDIVFDAYYASSSEGMREAIVETADSMMKAKASGDESAFYGEITEHFTNDETAQFMANILSDTGLGDFAMVTHTGQKEGVLNEFGAAGRLHMGTFTDVQELIISCSRAGYASTLDLTGAQIKALLENGKTVNKKEVVNEETGEEAVVASTAFEYFWSGIEVTKADGKVTSVKLNDKEIDDATTYTVVFLTNDYPEEYTQQALLKESHLIHDVVIDYVKAHTPLTAPEVLR